MTCRPLQTQIKKKGGGLPGQQPLAFFSPYVFFITIDVFFKKT